MTDTATDWMRDWAIVGGMTCALTPGVVGVWAVPDLMSSGFVVATSLLGTLSGGLVGLALFEGFSRVEKRFWLAASLVIAVPLLGAWGALVGASAALFTEPGMVWLALPCGSLSALALTGWLAPVYVVLARAGQCRYHLVVMGSFAGAPLCAGLCVVAVVGLFNVIGGW